MRRDADRRRRKVRLRDRKPGYDGTSVQGELADALGVGR